MEIYFWNMRGNLINIKNRLAICILSCYNDGIKR